MVAEASWLQRAAQITLDVNTLVQTMHSRAA
jgi:hypothetical protein